MFSQLFKDPDAIKRHRYSPLLKSRLNYLKHCAEQGMAKITLQTLAERMLRIIEYLELNKTTRKIDVVEIEEAADRWVNRQLLYGNITDPQEVKKRFFGAAFQWLRFAGRLRYDKEANYPFSFMIDEFINYLSREKGLSEFTIRNYHSCAKDFLNYIYKNNLSLSELTISKIQEILISKAKTLNWSRITIRHYANSLRAFLKYAQMRNWRKVGINEIIMTPCIYTQEGLPMGPSWETVQLLISSVDGDNKVHVRDLAIILLLAIYGLRSGEVRQLKLEDINWENEQFVVKRTKQGKTQIYPLSHTVGEAILRYLKESRPKTACREVFLTTCFPIKPLTRDGIYSLVRRHLQSLNVKLKHYGPHSLRHACASHLLAEGLSLKEIGDYLGHRVPSATRIYAKVDINGLREVANFQLGGLL